jgi:hypothetical protein
VTERIVLRNDRGQTLDGWVLNVSLGGTRAILEAKVELGQTFEVVIGQDETVKRPGRVVWVQEEPDGVVVGIGFTSPGGPTGLPPPDKAGDDKD